jgi:hypothetical protein
MPGSLIYEGPSMLDAQPIFVAAIWNSSNRKTGDLMQTYIMRSDINPLDASKYGEDYSICGDCGHRGDPTLDPMRKVAARRACYVNLGQGPLIVWKQYEKGVYRLQDTQQYRRELGLHQKVRIGTYGDAAAVPAYVWKDLLHNAKGWTGYTHNGADPEYCMISADNLEVAQRAWSKGYRTFRILKAASERKPNEVLCPASAEAGFKTTCAHCMLCAGTSTQAKSVAIVAHGTGRNFI